MPDGSESKIRRQTIFFLWVPGTRCFKNEKAATFVNGSLPFLFRLHTAQPALMDCEADCRVWDYSLFENNFLAVINVDAMLWILHTTALKIVDYLLFRFVFSFDFVNAECFIGHKLFRNHLFNDLAIAVNHDCN